MWLCTLYHQVLLRSVGLDSVKDGGHVTPLSGSPMACTMLFSDRCASQSIEYPYLHLDQSHEILFCNSEKRRKLFFCLRVKTHVSIRSRWNLFLSESELWVILIQRMSEKRYSSPHSRFYWLCTEQTRIQRRWYFFPSFSGWRHIRIWKCPFWTNALDVHRVFVSFASCNDRCEHFPYICSSHSWVTRACASENS